MLSVVGCLSRCIIYRFYTARTIVSCCLLCTGSVTKKILWRS